MPYSDGVEDHDDDCTCSQCRAKLPAQELKRKILAKRDADARKAAEIAERVNAERDKEARAILTIAKAKMEETATLIYECQGMIEDYVWPHLVKICEAEGFVCKSGWRDQGYLGGVTVEIPNTISENLWQYTEELCAFFEKNPVHAPGVRVLYPSRYCRRQFQAFYDLAGVGGLLIVGMNPGPHGMGQTGGAFTDQPIMRDLIGANALRWHDGDMRPESPIGRWRFDNGESDRQEDSASRLWPLLWDLVREQIGVPKTGMSHHKIVARNVVMINACPVLWLAENGNNVSAADTRHRVVLRSEHYAAIHEYLRRVGRDVLAPAAIVAAGDWAAKRCAMAFGTGAVAKMTHPSPIAGSEETWRGKASPVLRAALDKVFT